MCCVFTRVDRVICCKIAHYRNLLISRQPSLVFKVTGVKEDSIMFLHSVGHPALSKASSFHPWPCKFMTGVFYFLQESLWCFEWSGAQAWCDLCIKRRKQRSCTQYIGRPWWYEQRYNRWAFWNFVWVSKDKGGGWASSDGHYKMHYQVKLSHLNGVGVSFCEDCLVM